MKTRIYKAILTALLLLSMAGSAMCTPDMDKVASHEEQKAIDAIQKAIDAKGYNWTAGVTSVSGLTDDEKKKLCGVKPINDQKDKDVKEKKPKKTDPVGTYPSTFDWRNVNGKDWMTPVKSQGGCGSCWAFSALGVVEAKINIQANDSNLDIDLSEQHLVSDCCDAGSCGSGWPGQALKYVRDTGVSDEDCFPYIASNCACTPCENWEDDKWNIISYNYEGSQSGYKGDISNYGPMSAVFRVYGDLFSYTGGVYQHTSGNFMGYHAIVIVGWNDTEGCWIIKNSWNSGWGENGYGRIPGEYFVESYGAYTVGEISEYPVKCGDVSGDGNVNILDVFMLFDYVTHGSPPINECAGDVSGDGNVNILDVMILEDYVIHGSPPLNCQC
jgi:C1A family cysteine protease